MSGITFKSIQLKNTKTCLKGSTKNTQHFGRE